MNVGGGEYEALRTLRDSGELTLRTRVFLTAERLDRWIDEGMRTGDGDGVLRIGGVKFFADGALGSLTAWMLEPYEGSNEVGFPLQPVEDLERDVRRCFEAGLAPAIHAIGDRANRAVLDILERARDLAPALPRRIEHAQLLAPEDLPRFAALGVTASAQPIHATQDMHKVDREWGARGAGAYTFATLAASGANIAFGSDTPVETMDPLAGVHAAVTRRRADGSPAEGWYPAERMSVAAALIAYTSGCAAAVNEYDSSGRIAAGYHADCVLLSDDIFSCDPMAIATARADLTIAGGRIVFERA
jgi:predicted amidohydrolase YtcJ